MLVARFISCQTTGFLLPQEIPVELVKLKYLHDLNLSHNILLALPEDMSKQVCFFFCLVY